MLKPCFCGRDAVYLQEDTGTEFFEDLASLGKYFPLGYSILQSSQSCFAPGLPGTRAGTI